MIRKWLEERRKNRDDREFRSGFNYAAGELLWGELPEKVEADISTINYTVFDRGIESALRKWRDKVFFT